MRAKRSKKYRKIMSAYNLQFSFRTPYQVLCDSNFLRQCHAFHMPPAKFLTGTLHGEAKPYITQCSLAKAMADHNRSRDKQNKGAGPGSRGDGKPAWLPLPTEVPLRYCKHKDAEGNEVGVIEEAECLVDLISGQPRGNEVLKNKNHYVLATAEEEDANQSENKARQQRGGTGQVDTSRKRKRGVDVREMVRQVPGVPIVYVKRSVMILEELSGASEKLIRGVERDKFREGLIGDVRGLKRKRENGEDDGNEDSDLDADAREASSKARGLRKVKGPNPLSMRKKKARPQEASGGVDTRGGETADAEGDEQQKKRRKRKRGKKGGEQQHNDVQVSAAQTNGTAVEQEA